MTDSDRNLPKDPDPLHDWIDQIVRMLPCRRPGWIDRPLLLETVLEQTI